MARNLSHDEEIDAERDVHDVVATWFSCKAAIPEGWRSEMNPIPAMALGDVRNLGRGYLDLMSRARKNARRLKALSDALSDLSSAIGVEYGIAQENYEVVGNMCGLVTLPNELLARILDIVVNQDQALTLSGRWKSALILSHVNQYFRSTALSCMQLWSSISGWTDKIIAGLSRSNIVLLDVQLSVGYALRSNPDGREYDLAFKPYLSEILSHSKRWRTLEIEFEYMPLRHCHLANYSSFGDLILRNKLRKVVVQSLESLYISNGIGVDAFFNYREFSNWDAPRLRQITADYYFPFSLPALTGVTRLEVSLRFGQIHLAGFVKELSRMKVLENFALKLDACGELEVLENGWDWDGFTQTSLPSILRLRIETEIHRPNTRPIIHSFFSSLSFPRALNLHVVISAHFLRTNGSAWPDFNEDTRCIFITTEQLPSVERFHFEANAKKLSILPGSFLSHRGHISIHVPIKLFPNLKHFKLYSNRALDISKQSSDDLVAYGSALEIETITIKLPSDDSTWDVVPFIADILRRQREQGDWDAFRQLVVMNYDVRSDRWKENALAMYEGDDALAWCDEEFDLDDVGDVDDTDRGDDDRSTD